MRRNDVVLRLSLLDLFLPSPAGVGTDAGLLSHKLAAGLAGRVRESIERAGWLPDTPYIGAWALVLLRCLGTADVVVREPGCAVLTGAG